MNDRCNVTTIEIGYFFLLFGWMGSFSQVQICREIESVRLCFKGIVKRYEILLLDYSMRFGMGIISEAYKLLGKMCTVISVCNHIFDEIQGDRWFWSTLICQPRIQTNHSFFFAIILMTFNIERCAIIVAQITNDANAVTEYHLYAVWGKICLFSV